MGATATRLADDRTRLAPDGVPVIRTALPGPRSRILLARQEERESRARSYPRRLPIAIRRGEGSFVEDEDGNVLIDFLTGAGVLALGHAHPELVEVIRDQAEVLTHGLDFPTAVKDDFTTELLSLLPERVRAGTRVHFCGPTGANAVEAAIKLCKQATGRGEIVAFHGGFHGMTHATMAVSGDAGTRSAVANTMPGVHFYPFAYCHRCPFGLVADSCDTNCATYLENALRDSHAGMTRPAAVLLELVQGEGGTVIAPPEFVRRVRAVTRELDIPLIVDEVQTGCGRTGEWFASDHYGIEPDVRVVSKMLSGAGMPVAAILYDERLDTWHPGAHTGTFRGNQLAFAAGAAFLRIMKRDRVLDNVRARADQARGRLLALQHQYPDLIRDVRCLGLMIGVEFGRPEAAALVQREAFARGLILELGGRHDSVARMLPPLNVAEHTMGVALEIFAEAAEVVRDLFSGDEEGLR